MIIDRQLTANFKLMEFFRSSEANRLNIKEQYEPSDDILKNVEILAFRLQPLCDLYNEYRKLKGLAKVSYFVSSGYRCKKLNDAINGSKTSAHMSGWAVDILIYIGGKRGTVKDNKDFHDFIVKNNKEGKIKFDQLINEYNHSWTHIGFKFQPNEYRNQTLKIG